MFSRVRIAIRFFFVGLAVGVLLAPRSGEQTRRMLREKADRLLNDVLDAASLGTADTGARSTDAGRIDDEAEAPRTTRSTNGGRTRSRAATTATTASTGSTGSTG
jgi:gas vesicle protein